MRYIIPISGKDSLTTAIVQTTRNPDLNYEFVFNPTGLELPEVFEWLGKVEKHFGKEIVHVGRPLHDIIVGYNYFLPGATTRYCTKESKIFPFIEWIGTDTATVYYGIRADEQREGFNNKTTLNIIPVYPLKGNHARRPEGFFT
jgi:3'-phosphoadenosine 5'-phosphosulfate sulfotransferase (PAPS reductase)/FAD synthetase